MNKPVIGKPKYKLGDTVSFYLKLQNGRTVICTGTIEIIDAYGTFEQSVQPSYDIMVDKWLDTNEKCFVKHIVESDLTLVTNI